MRLALLPVLAVALAACQAQAVAPVPAANGPASIVRVIDGDTFVLDGETIRIANLDAPESGNGAECPAEAMLAVEATSALEEIARLWAVKAPTVERQGRDRYGRTLARVSDPIHGDTGEAMIDKGWAVEWTGARFNWCGPIRPT
ncbi:thermonuclease family protein [Brevundimonas sp.]|uniref:thermonuclease family protein n=1 Tax=Brevundimonas sp. TaxID=1871086 RepID=UPI002D426615|nr:thermonuclease family protein [Brevundimonas sp.]HYC98501.1 thermonuclease family protein [Brevundimonas sp.]